MSAFYRIPEPRLDPPEYLVPECPVCRSECMSFFRNINREIIGCENCLEEDEEYEDEVDAWEATA